MKQVAKVLDIAHELAEVRKEIWDCGYCDWADDHGYSYGPCNRHRDRLYDLTDELMRLFVINPKHATIVG